MHQWLIRSWRIISVKSANLKLSLSARLCQILLLTLLSWALAVSPAPMVCTLFVFFSLILPIFPQIIQPSVQLRLVWGITSECRINEEKRILSRSWLDFSAFVTLLIFDDGSRLLVWRDACTDCEYRALTRYLRLQNGKKKSGNTLF